jgi:CRP/FNR family transcriptional regulator, nitrogen fixation regulation protein
MADHPCYRTCGEAQVLLPLDYRAPNSTSGSAYAPSTLSTFVADCEKLDPLVALEQIGIRRCFRGEEEIYSDGDAADCWYRVVSGTVRICKLLADGRRHISKFCFPGDSFGQPAIDARVASAEAIDEVVVMRYPQRAVERLIQGEPRLAGDLYDRTLRELTIAQHRMLLLGRMTAVERVASFLIEISDRRRTRSIVDLPMARIDIADYLGLTIETVCRELSKFKRDGIISRADQRANRLFLRDRDALEIICDPATRRHRYPAARAAAA